MNWVQEWPTLEGLYWFAIKANPDSFKGTETVDRLLIIEVKCAAHIPVYIFNGKFLNRSDFSGQKIYFLKIEKPEFPNEKEEAKI